MSRILRSITKTFDFKGQSSTTVKKYAILPVRARIYERILGRMEILRKWAEADYPDTEFYFAFDSMCKEVIVSNHKRCKRIPYRAFLRGHVYKAYRKYCSA